MPRGVPSTVAPSGDARGRAAFALAMRRLAAVEALPVYAEMCADAERRIRDGGGRLGEHGWGEFSANGDPRKARKRAS